MWPHLPPARSRLLAFTAAGLAAFYAAVAIGFAVNIVRMPVGLVIAPLFGLLALGMWQLSRFARWVTIIWLWVMVLLMPVAALRPSPGADTVYWGTLLAAVTPFVVLGLFCIYVLGKHKREFMWP